MTKSTTSNLPVEAHESSPRSKVEAPAPVSRDVPLPLSFGQERLLFLEQLDPDTSRWNLHIARRWRGPLAVDALGRALDELIARHEPLRTTFSSEHTQVIAPPSAAVLVSSDLAAAADPAAEAVRRVKSELDRPLDLQRGPVCRATLFRLGPDDHVLLFVVHHAAADGVTLEVLEEELLTLYDAFRQGAPSPLTRPSLQYADYAAWHRRWVEGREERQLAYWKKQLEGAPNLELTTDRPRPPNQTFVGVGHEFVVPAELADAVAALARAERVTPFMVYQAAFVALLSRYTALDDVSVAVPVANRPRPELASMVGFLVNTLIVRTDLSGQPTVRDLLKRVRATTLSALANQDLPFERLVESLRPTRDPSRSPLTQVMFSAYSIGKRRAIDGVKLEPFKVDRAPAHYDMTLVIDELDGKFQGTCEYNVDLFDRATIARFVGHYLVLLDGMTRSPDASHALLPMMAEDETRRVVHEWNQTDRALGEPRFVHEMIEASAQSTPDAVALVFEEERVSYRDLDADANRLANELRRRGVGRGSVVAVCMERSVELFVAVLGVLKAGAAYAPLDPTHPPARLAMLADDLATPVVLTMPKSSGPFASLALPVDRAALRAVPASKPAVSLADGDLAYVIYTSGSTGTPKGVMSTHGGMRNRLMWAQAQSQLGPDDVVLQKTPYTFDVSVWELFWPLMIGARIVIARPEGHKDPQYVARTIREQGVTLTHFVPSMLAVFLESYEPGSTPSLRRVVCSGEALSRALQDRFLERVGCELLNLYGPTEASIDVSFWRCSSEDPPGEVPIGRPIFNTRLYVVDRSGLPCPIGAPGELVIGGVGVARGYSKRPELTADRFVPDPFSKEPGARMYRTGDLARWRSDGAIEYLGRIDHQIKIRGLRVELGEIEASLASCAGVAAAVVVAREDVPGDKRLVAYVVPAAGTAIDVVALKGALGATLPDYMVPSAFVVLDALPLTTSGKTDRFALPAPNASAFRHAPYVEPRTPIEQVLVSIWSDILRVERLGVLDDFFEIGGHSLLAMRVVSRIRRALSIDIPLRALFDAKNVRALATVIEGRSAEGHEQAIEHQPRTGPLPASFAQERLWFLDKYEPGTATFNLPHLLRWSGPLDADVLVRAIDALVERHESLRTTFSASEGAPLQVIAAPGRHAHRFVDVSKDVDPEASALRVAETEATRGFDLSTGPLFRTVLVRLRDDEHLLLMLMHHIVSDGWSLAILHDELVATYGAFLRREPSPLRPLAVQYADFAVWQRSWLEGARLKAQVEFWKGELANAPVLELPTDHPRPPVRSSRGRTHTFSVPENVMRGLSALARSEGVSSFMVVFAATAALLSRISGQTDLIAGVPVANRTRAELEPIVGFFVNQLPLRVSVAGRPSTRQLLARVREKTLALYANQDVPFERLVDELRVPRDPSRSPIFQVHVGVDEDANDLTSPEGVSLASFDVEYGVAKVDLAFQARIAGGAMRVDLAYSTELFDAVTIERLARRFNLLLEGMTRSPDALVGELPIVDARERRRLLAEWSSPGTAPSRTDESLHGFVAAQVAKTPEALALADGHASLSYRELDVRATALATRLAARGVRRGDIVALLLPRDVHAIVAMLAVLKAGAAYLPLDPALPTARLQYILDDSDARLALGTEELAGGVLGARIITLKDAESGPGGASLPSVTGRDLAYIIYTSGSTGVPKAACVEHRSIAALAREQAAARKLGTGSRHAQYASLSFDAHVSEVWPALVSGASLHLCPDATRADAPAVVEWFARERINWAFIPTQVGEECLRGAWPDVALVGLGFGGDTFHGVPHRSYSFDVLNVYGPTECTCVTSSLVVRPGDARPGIGRPIGGAHVYLLDEGCELAPAGSVGEICIGGQLVGRGYLRRPELTAERFVPDPFSDEPGARMYRTGDLGRWRNDGVLEHLGRMDHQVKVRGFRIELGEIEAAVRELPNVAESVVVLREDKAGDKRIVAYIVEGGGASSPDGRAASMTAGDRRAALQKKLPDYMIPSAFVTLPAFDIDVRTGKVDRKNLPAPELIVDETASFVAPTDPIEVQIASIWSEVLDVPRVGSDDDFFELGGHSLKAVLVTARLRRDFGVEVPMSALFSNPTLRGLAQAVAELKREESVSVDDAPIPTIPRDGQLALSYTQERLWFLAQLDPDSTAYHLWSAVRLVGQLDVTALERTFAELLRRHEILRTAVVAVDGTPFQVIQPVPEHTVDIVDRAGATEAEIQALLDAGLRARFDLTKSVFRVTLVRLAPEEHLLIVCVHHIACDGWSKSVLEREIQTIYEAFSSGQASPLAPLPVQFADYAAWQRAQMQTPRAAEDLAYWKEHLAGAPPALELPTDRARGPVQTYSGEYELQVLSRELTSALNEAARVHGASLFMTMLAAFTLVLSRHAGQEDVVVGVPVAERSRPELEPMIGILLNTIALRVSTSGAPTFAELLARAKETALAGFAHQDVPFEQLVDELGVERNLSRSPIFQVMLVSTKFDAGATFKLKGLSVEAADTETITSKYDLTLYFDDDSGLLKLWLVYNPDLFDRVRMRDMLAQLVGVLEQALDAPETPAAALSLVTSRARDVLPAPQAVLDATWRGAVTEIFARRAAESPERLAVADAVDSWTYGELEARSNQLAHRLLQSGCERGERVAIFAHRSASLVCAVLGVLKAGCAFTMLDPAYPADRIVQLLEISGARALVRIGAGGSLPDLAVEWTKRAKLRAELDVPRKGGLDEVLGALPSTSPGVALGADDYAYVAFTSGSTGLPKGVLGRHGPLTHFNPWLCREFGLGADDRFTMLSGLAHDPLHRDIFTPLQLGASIHILSTEEINVPGRLAAWMAAERVTVAHMTPAFGQLLTDSAEEGTCIASLRRVFLVGDVLTKRDVDRMRAIAPNLTCVNYYGSTETQRAVSYHVVVDGDRGPLPLGRGMPGVQLLVVTRGGKLAGIGEVGELVLRSPHLAKGYLGDAELSAAKFVSNPLGAQSPTDRAYRTGDLGRYLPNGEAVFAGRADRQVKIRGFRVEPSEIEATLSAHAAIREVVVLAREDRPGDKRLVAYVVCNGGVALPAAELRELVSKRLPDYMVPSAFVFLEKMPVTPNGKLDRAALPAPQAESATETYVAPRGAIEELLATHWCDVLGLAKVSATDNFFELGGNSLLAVRLVARVRRDFGVELPVREFFTSPTIRGIGAAVEKAKGQGTSLEAQAPLVPCSRDAAPLLSFTQERLWFLSRLEPDSSAYTIRGAVRLEGKLSLEALEQSLEAIVHRHDILRMTFQDAAGQPVARIAPRGPVPLEVIDAPGASADDVARRVEELFARPFDLSRSPVRFALLRISDEEHVLVTTMHHIVADGWSVQVLYRELSRLYEAFAAGQPSPLEPLQLQFADYAAWQRTVMSGDVAKASLDYWLKHLEGAPPALELPTDRPHSIVKTHRGESESTLLSNELTQAVLALGRAAGASTFMTLLAAFSALLARQSGQDDVVVGVPVAHRPSADLEGLIGLFLNTLALRMNVSSKATFRELVVQAREASLAGYAHQDVPFETIVEHLQPERSLVRTPIFQVMLVNFNFQKDERTMAGLRVTNVELPDLASKFDITFYIDETPEGLALAFNYAADVFDRARIREMLAGLKTLLARAVAQPDVPVSSLSLVTPTSVQLLPDPTATLDDRWYGSVADVFAQVAARAPERLAVADAREEWTYAELDARSNQLAHRLLAAGCGKGDPVAILAHRSASLAWAVLGVLKAGASFVILDPAYPAARQVAILEAARPRAVVRVTTELPIDVDVAAWVANADLRDRIDCPRKSLIGNAFDTFATTSPGVAVGPDDVAYLAFTSGSTGKPKGIVGRHGPLSHFHPWRVSAFELGEEDRFGMLSGLAHDPFHRDLFTPLQLGASLHAIDPDALTTPGELSRWMSEQKITVAHLTPAFAQLLGDDARLDALRRLFLVGDALTVRDVVRFREIAPNAEIVNYYGATETQQALAYYAIPETALAWDPGAVIPLGRGAPGVQVLVLNGAGQLAAIGEIGEICMRSPHLARGYLDDEELTRTRFVENPFRPGAAGDRMYRTGDLGRYAVTGDVVFAGRADGQVKIRGFRVELSEVEAALQAESGVREAVVIAREDSPGDKRLVAYVVTDDGCDVAGLRDAVAQKLPSYMVPTAVVKLDTLPLTPNGKLDRKALPAPDDVEVEDWGAAEYEPPTTPTEHAVAKIWQEVLDVERVGLQDDYFELGGHSLNAMRMIARVREQLGLSAPLPLRQVFMTSRLVELAEYLDGALAREAKPREDEKKEDAAAPAITRIPREGPLPLSFAQERLWFLSRLEPESTAYVMPSGVRLVGELSLAALEQALTEFVTRHEVLRMTIHDEDGLPNVRVAPPAPVSVAIVEMAGASDEAVKRRIDEEFRIPIDMTRAMYRFTLLRLSDQEHVLLAPMHHVVGDGWSAQVFNRELSQLYEAFASGKPSPLPELPLQYADYAAWQRQVMAGDQGKAALAYWVEHLAGAPTALELPTDRPYALVTNRRGEEEHVLLSKDLTQALHALAKAESASTFMTVYAAFSLLLGRQAGQEEVVIGVPVAHRPVADLENLIGIFLNTLALKLDVSGNPTFRELLGQARDTTLGAFAHQEVPFETVVEHLKPERSLLRTPVFQVTMVGMTFPKHARAMPGLSALPVDLPTTSSKFDMTLYVEEPSDGLYLSLAYAADFFDRARIKELLAELTVLLASAVERPDTPIKSLSLVTSAGRKVLPDPMQRLEAQPHAPVPWTIFEVPSSTPSLAWGDVRWSSGELQTRVRALAGRLAASGVRRGARVMVTGAKSPGLVAAMLGVWSLGAVIVPINEETPDERRLMLAEEANATHAIVAGPDTTPWGIPVLRVDGATGAVDGGTNGAPVEPDVTEEDAAYVFFTSGTTGKPKGVLGQHRGLSHFLKWQREQFGIGPGDRAAQLTGLGFDVVMRDIFTPLSAGALLCIPPEPLQAMEGAKSLRWLQDNEITLMHSVPSVMSALLPLWEGEEPLLGVRLIFMAGEPLTDVLVSRLRAHFPNARIVNLYGPTETTLAKCFYEVPSEPRVGIQPVGQPLPGTQVLILNEAGALAGIGEPGEIVIRTPYRTLGYLGGESDRFQTNPFTKLADDVVYRTGDRGRYRVDGVIEILGRVDDQVKILGVRVEPAEVAATLLEHPGVRECFVTAFKDPEGRNALAAYLVFGGWPPEESELRTYMATRVPRAMIPSVFTVLEKMPLSPNGKVDRKALPEPVLGVVDTEKVLPRTPLEETIHKIWKEVLKVDGFGVHDDYFALGGHSLNAMQVITRIRTAVNTELPLGVLFESPTVAELAAAIEARTAGLETGEI